MSAAWLAALAAALSSSVRDVDEIRRAFADVADGNEDRADAVLAAALARLPVPASAQKRALEEMIAALECLAAKCDAALQTARSAAQGAADKRKERNGARSRLVRALEDANAETAAAQARDEAHCERARRLQQQLNVLNSLPSAAAAAAAAPAEPAAATAPAETSLDLGQPGRKRSRAERQRKPDGDWNCGSDAWRGGGGNARGGRGGGRSRGGGRGDRSGGGPARGGPARYGSGDVQGQVAIGARARGVAHGTTGADMPSAQDEEPQLWPETMAQGQVRPGGYKVLVEDMPSTIARRQIEKWITAKKCPVPIDVSDVALSRRGRGQICVTFDRADEAALAKTKLHNNDLESGARPTRARYWQIGDGY